MDGNDSDDGLFLTQSTYRTQYSDISSDETGDKVNTGDNLDSFGDGITQSDDELVSSCIVMENLKKVGESSKTSTTIDSRFHEPVPDDEVNELKTKKFANSTVSKIKWATTLFKEWQSNRNKLAADTTRNLSSILVPLEEMSIDELNYTISRFIFEVKKTDGSDFPSDTLYGLVICLQLHMDNIGKTYKFLTDDSFLQVKNTLDNMMKRRAKEPSIKAPVQAEVITQEEEEVMWSKGVLGSDTPKQLVDTIFYLVGINFALRGGQEHRNLRAGNTSQFTVSTDEHGRVPIYTEDILSKSNQGGLKHRKYKAKSVRAYENLDNPERCLVSLFVKYLSKRPPPKTGCDPFYLRPLRKPTGDVWYSSQGIGRHTLAATVSDLCKRAGLTGHRTNHSLGATAATRLFEAGVDEQLICEVSGHRSSAVRSYKRTNAAQKRKLSSLLQAQASGQGSASSTISSRADTKESDNTDKRISFTFNVNVN